MTGEGINHGGEWRRHAREDAGEKIIEGKDDSEEEPDGRDVEKVGDRAEKSFEEIAKDIIEDVRTAAERSRKTSKEETQWKSENGIDASRPGRETQERPRQEAEEDAARNGEEFEQEDRERHEMHTKESVEQDREERVVREQTAESEEYAEEQEILRGFEEYGIDPEEVKRRWRERFLKDAEEYIKEDCEETEELEESGGGQSVETRSYYTDESGMLYELKTDNNNSREINGYLEEVVDEEQDSPTNEEKLEIAVDEKQTDSEQSETQGHVSGENQLREQESSIASEESSEDEKVPEENETIESEVRGARQNRKASQGGYERGNDERNEDQEFKDRIEAVVQDDELIDVKHVSTKETGLDNEYNKRSRMEEGTEEKEEVWTDELEEARWRKMVEELFNDLSDEDKEEFRQYLESLIEDIDTANEIRRKHGLDELDKEEEREIQEFLRFRKACRENPDKPVEEIASELQIDLEQAKSWTDRRNHPEAIREVLNLEAYLQLSMWYQEIIESEYPRSLTELEEALQKSPALQLGGFYQLEFDEGRMWVEIKGMQHAGKIDYVVREGRLRYKVERIRQIAREYNESPERVYQIINGTYIPELIRQLKESRLRHFDEFLEFETGTLIRSWRIYLSVLSRNLDLLLHKGFTDAHKEVIDYFKILHAHEISSSMDITEYAVENMIDPSNARGWAQRLLCPSLIKTLNMREENRLYLEHEGALPVTTVRSMTQLRALIEKMGIRFESKHEANCLKYFRLLDEKSHGVKPKALAEKYNVSESTVYDWISDTPPYPIGRIQQIEQRRIIHEWVQAKFSHIPKGDIGNIRIANLLQQEGVRMNKSSLEFVKNKMNIILAYGEDYFYFKNIEDFISIIFAAQVPLGIKNRLHLYNTLEEVRRVSSEIFNTKTPVIRHNTRRNKLRIQGKQLALILQLAGMTPSDLEGKIEKITGSNGLGGIKNPRFPAGEKLLELIARLQAIIVTDGHLKPNGVVEYYEPEIERHKLVEKILREFGEIELSPVWKKRDNYYYSCFPSPIGNASAFWGLKSGDKAIQNTELDVSFFEESKKACFAIIEESLAQDGSVGKGYASWSFSNTLNSGNTGMYDKPDIISPDEIELIKKEGTQYKKPACWQLPWTRLVELKKSESEETSRLARSIEDKILAHPNKLILSIYGIAKRVGLNIPIVVDNIRFYHKTGRVSVAWRARTKKGNNAIRLAILAPPNDIVKKSVYREWLQSIPDEVDGALEELEAEGYTTTRWWDNDE